MKAGLITWCGRTSARARSGEIPTALRRSRLRLERSLRLPGIKKMIKGYLLVLAVTLTATMPAFAQLSAEQTAGQAPGTQALGARESSPQVSGPSAVDPTALGAGAGAGVPWSRLSGEQQKLLGKFSEKWNTLPPERQQALARGSDRWLAMSPDQRGQAQQRFQRWHSLPPDQRRALRDRWERFQTLPPDQQAAVRQNFRRFRQLPPEKRQMLRERWHNASPAERQQMIEHAREQHMRRMEMPAPARPHR